MQILEYIVHEHTNQLIQVVAFLGYTVAISADLRRVNKSKVYVIEWWWCTKGSQYKNNSSVIANCNSVQRHSKQWPQRAETMSDWNIWDYHFTIAELIKQLS